MNYILNNKVYFQGRVYRLTGQVDKKVQFTNGRQAYSVPQDKFVDPSTVTLAQIEQAQKDIDSIEIPGVPVYIQPTKPTNDPPYVWIDNS